MNIKKKSGFNSVQIYNRKGLINKRNQAKKKALENLHKFSRHHSDARSIPLNFIDTLHITDTFKHSLCTEIMQMVKQASMPRFSCPRVIHLVEVVKQSTAMHLTKVQITLLSALTPLYLSTCNLIPGNSTLFAMKGYN